MSTPVAGGPQTEAGRRFVENWNLGLDQPVAIWDLQADILTIEAEAQRLTVERLAPWLRHSEDTRDLPCGFYTGEPCDCGLRAALAHPEEDAA